MICIDYFPEDKLREVDIHRTLRYQVLNIHFENGHRINLFLSEDEMTDLLHKLDAAKEKWLNEKDVSDRSTEDRQGVEDAIR